MKAIRVRLALLLVISSILTILTPFIVVGQTCDDIDGNYSVDVLDASYLVNYLWKNGPAPYDPEYVGLIDGYAGLTHNDLMYWHGHYYLGGPAPVCVEINDSILTVTDDSLEIRGGEIPPGVTGCKLDLWLKPVSSIWALDFSFSYWSSALSCELDSIAFEGSLFSDFIPYVQINTDSNGAAIGVLRNHMAQIPPSGEGLLASLWFTVSSSGQPQYITIDTCRFLSRHVTLLSKDGHEPVKPTIVGLDAFDRTTWYVDVITGDDDTGTGSFWYPFATIQHAMNMAGNNDTVMVQPGTYSGIGNRDLDPGGKPLSLLSSAGRDNTIIDCYDDVQPQHWGIRFISGEDSTTVMDGFTIRYAHNDTINVGGAVRCLGASPVIRNCLFEYSRCGMVCGEQSSPMIENCNFIGNENNVGGGMRCSSSSPTIVNCDFVSNLASIGGGLACVDSSAGLDSPELRNCNFIGNVATAGGGIGCIKSSPDVMDCAFVGDTVGREGMGSAVWCRDTSYPVFTGCLFAGCYRGGVIYADLGWEAMTFVNCTFVENRWSASVLRRDSKSSFENCIMAFNDFAPVDGNPNLICCDIYGNDGGDWVGDIADQYGVNGNFSADPLFCYSTYDDYTISSSSPCAADGNECGVLIGALGVGCQFVCGDANSDGAVNLLDATFLINYLYRNGPAPYPAEYADVDSSGGINILDVGYLINYLYRDGPEPDCPER